MRGISADILTNIQSGVPGNMLKLFQDTAYGLNVVGPEEYTIELFVNETTVLILNRCFNWRTASHNKPTRTIIRPLIGLPDSSLDDYATTSFGVFFEILQNTMKLEFCGNEFQIWKDLIKSHVIG